MHKKFFGVLGVMLAFFISTSATLSTTADDEPTPSNATLEFTLYTSSSIVAGDYLIVYDDDVNDIHLAMNREEATSSSSNKGFSYMTVLPENNTITIDSSVEHDLVWNCDGSSDFYINSKTKSTGNKQMRASANSGGGFDIDFTDVASTEDERYFDYDSTNHRLANKAITTSGTNNHIFYSGTDDMFLLGEDGVDPDNINLYKYNDGQMTVEFSYTNENDFPAVSGGTVVKTPIEFTAYGSRRTSYWYMVKGNSLTLHCPSSCKIVSAEFYSSTSSTVFKSSNSTASDGYSIAQIGTSPRAKLTNTGNVTTDAVVTLNSDTKNTVAITYFSVILVKTYSAPTPITFTSSYPEVGVRCGSFGGFYWIDEAGVNIKQQFVAFGFQYEDFGALSQGDDEFTITVYEDDQTEQKVKATITTGDIVSIVENKGNFFYVMDCDGDDQGKSFYATATLTRNIQEGLTSTQTDSAASNNIYRYNRPWPKP